MANKYISTIKLPNDDNTYYIKDEDAQSRIEILEKVGLQFIGISIDSIEDGSTRLTVDVKDGDAPFEAAVDDVSKFGTQVHGVAGKYKFRYDGAEWKYESSTTATGISLEEWGMSVSIKAGKVLDSTCVYVVEYKSSPNPSASILDYAKRVNAKKGNFTICKTGSTSREFIFDGTNWWEMGSTGALKAMAFCDTASGQYTPAGSVSITGGSSTTSTEEITAYTASVEKNTETLKFTSTAKTFVTSVTTETPSGTFTGTEATITVAPVTL